MTEHKKLLKINHATMNFTMIMSQFACQFCGPIGKIFFEAARIYQSHRASFILHTRMHGVPCYRVCTLLPGALDSYRDRINILLVSIWVFPQLNISLRVQVFIPGLLLTLLITSTFFFKGLLMVALDITHYI